MRKGKDMAKVLHQRFNVFPFVQIVPEGGEKLKPKPNETDERKGSLRGGKRKRVAFN